MALKKYQDQKFRKKDGMPYGFNATAKVETVEAEYNDNRDNEALERENTIAELRKARNDASMQRLISSDEYAAKQKEYRLRAIEIAKEKVNAGNDRTTALRQPQQNIQGNAILPTYQGMNIASNGADVDPEKFKTEAATKNGWKGLGNTAIGRQIKGNGVTEKESLAHAQDVMNRYSFSDKAMSILDEYVAKDDESKRAGLWRFESQGSYSGALMNLGNKFKSETGVSDEEFKNIFESYSRLKHAEEREAQQQEYADMSTGERVAKSIVKAPKNVLGGYQGLVGSLQNPSDPELGRDYNSEFFRYSNENTDIRKAQNDEIEKIENPAVRTLAHFGYNAGVMGVESATAALTGEVGLGSFFAGGYNAGLKDAEDRGLSPEQSQAYALAVGSLEYFTERIPWEGLKNIWAGNAVSKDVVKGSIAPYIKALLKQSGSEATEEVINGIGETIADGIIAGDKSNLNIAIQNYMQQEGLSEEDATRKAIWDIVKDTADAAITAAISAGVSAGPALASQAYTVTKAGRNLADYENKTGNLTRNVENEVYISENREDYDSDEAYNQAMQTRADILAASEKIAKNEKLKGKEARALYESYANIERGTKQEKEVNKTENVKPEEEEIEKPKKSYAQIVEDIEFASTPYQLATAIDQVTEETEEIRELIDYKKKELEMFNFKPEEIDNAITEKKALEMGNKGEEVTAEQLEKIPVQDRQKVLEANNQAYNKSILKEHPDAVVDKSTGKYFVPAEVKVEGADVVITDTDGNTHSDFENPRINQVMQLVTKTSVDMRGHATDQSMYSTNVEQAAYAIELAVKSPEATSALVRTAVESILDTASVGHKSWEEYLKTSKGLFTKVDEATAEKLYKSIQKPARKSDSRKTENVEGKKTSDKVVSDTLRENLPEETVSLLEALGKKIGYNFVASTNPNARGSITPGTRQISIGTNSLDELWSITAHEAIAEYLQAHGNEADVTAIQDDMLKYLENKLGSKAFNDLINQYQTVYRESAKKGSVDENKTRRAAANEMFNDTVFALISSEEGVKDYLDWLNGNNAEVSFFQKVKDFFKSLFDFVSNYIKTGNFNAAEKAALEMDAKASKEFRDRIFKLMDEAIENANSSTESNYNSAEDNSRQSIKPDDKYLEAYKDNDYKKMQQMVDKAAREAGYNSPKLYHGTQDFGFTSFDLDKMDDKTTIFLTSNPNIASTYSGSATQKTIDQRYKEDIAAIPNERLAEELNKSRADDGMNYEYEYYDSAKIDKLEADTLDGIRKLYDELPALLDNTSDEKALQALKKIREIQMLFSVEDVMENVKVKQDLSTAIYMAVHHSKALSEYKEAWDKLQQNIRKAYSLTHEKQTAIEKNKNYNPEYIIENYLDGYLFEVMSTLDAENKLYENHGRGIYSLYAKMGKTFEVEANKMNWDALIDWTKNYVDQFNKEDVSVYIDNDRAYLATDDGTILFDIAANEAFTSQSKEEQLDDIYGRFKHSFYSRAMLDYGNTTRSVAKFAKNHGYDSVIIRNVRDNGGRNHKVDYDELADIYLLFNPNNIKSADPVTYDDNGNIIPLSERFNDSTSDLRYSIKVDSSGRELSEGQKEYFKDSKVVDEEGRLRVVYHGTMAEFNIFDLKEARDTEDIEAFFFSGDIEEAEGYGNLGEYYLNITNPADYKTAYDIFFKYKGKEHAGRLAREELQSMGYDGVIAVDEDSPEYTEYLAFNSNQIKQVDNLNPTEDADIRKSIKVDNQGRELSKGQQEYFKNSKVINDNGDLMVLYHGSEQPGFTKFGNPKNWFTTNRDVAASYAASNNNIILDNVKSLDRLNELLSDTDYSVEQKNGKYVLYEQGFIDTREIDSFKTLEDTINAANEALSEFDEGRIYEAYINLTNPLEVDAQSNDFDNIEYDGNVYQTFELADYAKDNGYDGLIIRNVNDPGPYSEFAEEGTESDIVVAFNPNQIKSVDNDNPTENEDIRYSKKVNSDGDPLTLLQEEMFKNSKAVDKKGNLLVLYHGSQSEEKFNTFDMNVRGAVNGRAFGDGYYFTPYKDVAEFWGDNNLYSVYLNLEHPYYANKSSKVPKDVRDLIVSRIEKSFAESGTKSFYSNKLLAMTDYLNEVHNAYDALEVLWNYGMINEIKSLGYDGVIFDDKDVPKYSVQYVAFNPEQIKETTNLNPTQEAKDIRYSISVKEDRIHTYKGIEIIQNPSNKEYQQMRADIIKERPWMDGPDTILLRHTYDEEGNEYYWDAYAGMHFEIEPIIAEHWKTRVNQQWEWWKDDDKDFWANRSFANRARNSIKVYGEASPYADSLNETKVIQTMIGTMNNALSKADAFDISNDELIRIENYIANKYKTDLEPGEIAANISYAFAHMQQNKLDTDYENMMNYLLNIGDEIIKKSNMIDPASKELYDQARAAVSSKRFKLSDAERAEISNAFGGSWKAAFGAMQKAGIKLDNKNGTSIDTIFSEIREDILKAAGVDMSDADKPSQQILSIIDTITALEPTAYLWDGANEMDKALTVVSDIVDQYYSVATEQLEKNIAKGTKKGNEKIKKAIDNEKAKLRGQWAKYKDEKAEEFNSIVAEKNLIIQQQQNQIKQQQEQMKQWNKDAKEKDKAVILDKKQMEATARLQAKQAVQNYKDREERAKQIENIKKTGIRLIKWLDNPTDNQHVPAFLQRPLAEFLSAIDFLPTNAKADSKSTLTWQQRMNDLREALVKIKDAESEGSNTAEAYFAQNIVAKELISMMDEFLGKEEWDEFTQSYIVTKRAAKKVSLLDAKELATLNKIMSALSVSINNMNKTLANNAFKHVSELAKASVKEVDALPAKKDMQKSLGKIFNFLNFDELEPITWFEGLGKGAKSVFQELRDGFDLKTRHVREADKYMDEAKKELGISDKELSTWKNQLHTFKLTEGTVMLNTTQIMSLYEILKRKQGRPHVAVGGIKAADFEYQDGKIKKKHHQPKAVHIRQTEAQAIIDTLTDEQKALADKMQQFMAKDCAAWGNRVTEKMYGYKKYEEKDYFPLKTDAHSRATTASSDNNVSYYTIKNSSFTKPITPMANNAVVLDDIFDVFTDHVVSMADYDAYVMPIADAMRWFNYSERVINAIAPDELNEQGARIDYLGNMQESIDRVYGDAGLQYFRQFIKDINGDYAGRGGKSEILSSLMSMYKAQAVGANMRVVIQQPTAVVRAADQIEPKYLIRALASIPKAIEYAKKAQKNSEIAYWKAQGYYETYLGQSFKEIITGDTTLKDKFNDWSGFLAGQADDLSWGIMYKACEIKVAETQPELTGASFDKAVTKMFEGIVDHTQVVDTIFHKSQWMRSQELGHKVTSAFMAEPTKTYNMLYRAYRDAKLSGNKAFAMKRLRQVGLIFLFEQLLNAIITGGWDVLRDDEKENYISSFTKKFSENALDNLNPLNLLPIAKEITSAIQGYDATAYTTDAIYTAVDSFNVLLKIAQGKSTKTSYGNVYQIAKAASQLTGVPVANVMREFKTIYNLVNDFWGGKDLVNTQAQEKKITKKRETNRVSEVFDSNDLTAIKQEIQTAYNKGVESSKDGSESDGWSAARNMLKEQYQRLSAEHSEENVALKNRFKSLLKYTKKADGKGGYRTLTDKEVENYITNWSAAE